MNQTVQFWLQQTGYAYNNTDPFASTYPAVATRNKPVGAVSPDFDNQCEACLRSRSLIYWKKTPGDCPTPSAPTNVTASSLKFAQIGISSASAIGKVAGLTGAASSALGIATLGAGLGLSVLLDIIEAHAQAVKTEQTDICGVVQYANSIIPQIDTLVASGQATPQDGINAMSSLAASVNGQLGSIFKTCNAACYFQGFMNAHADFAKVYYPALTPTQLTPVNPGQPSTTATASVTGAVAPVVAAAATAAAQSTSSIAGFSVTTILLALAAIGVVLFFVMGTK